MLVAMVVVVVVVALLSMVTVVTVVTVVVVVPRCCGRHAHPAVVVLSRMVPVAAQGPMGVGRRRRFH